MDDWGLIILRLDCLPASYLASVHHCAVSTEDVA